MGFIRGIFKRFKDCFKFKRPSKCLLGRFCLRRLTFFQQQKKVSKKCRPSSAGEADFPQIPIENATRNLAYEIIAFIKLVDGRNGAENHGCFG